MTRRQDLAALVGSRICHDLISPIGAIGNGLELMTLAGFEMSKEMTLISESAENANARIRFFRIAYGSAVPGQSISRAETLAILRANAMSGRMSYAWDAEGDLPRAILRVIFLLFQCFDSVLISGGEIHIAEREGSWVVRANAARIKPMPDLWDMVRDPRKRVDLNPSQVQFALLPEALRDAERSLSLELGDDRITASF